LRALLMFNLPAALLAVAVAAVVNPTASGDDLAIVVTVPLLVLVLLMRAIMIWRPQPELAPEQREEATQALKQLIHKARWLRPLMASTVLLVWAIASLLAVPIYAAFGLESGLILYGFAWAGILFGLGVILFIVAIICMHPDGEFFHIRTKNISPARPTARSAPAAPSRLISPAGHRPPA